MEGAPAIVYRVARKPVANTASYKVVEERELEVPTNDIEDDHQDVQGITLLQLWWQELLACVLSVSALAGLVTTLSVIDTKPLPNLPYRVSINTLIAIFATVLKIPSAFVLAEGLGQSKWTWYLSPRRLHDFLAYDNATRGPWGAIQFLWFLRFQSLVPALGAIITIAATIADPLSQQLVRLLDCNDTLSGDIAQIPRTNLFDEFGAYIDAQRNQLSSGFVGSIPSGQFASYPPQVPFSCSSGNCTFDQDFHSLGYCSECTDVSSQLKFSVDNNGGTSSASFNINITLDAYESRQNLLQAGDCGRSISVFTTELYSSGPDGFGFLDMLWFDGVAEPWATPTLPRAHAYRCRFIPCAQTFRARVENGRLQEKVLHRELILDGPSGRDYWAYSTVNLECLNHSSIQDLRDLGYNFDDNDLWLLYNVSVDPAEPESSPRRYSSRSSGMIQTDAGREKGYYVSEDSTWTLSDTGRRVVPSQCIYQLNWVVTSSLERQYFGDHFRSIRSCPNNTVH